MRRGVFATMLLAVMWGHSLTLSAQALLEHYDSLLADKYRKSDVDTAYVVRPQTKWTLRTRLNVSGTEIETEGHDEGRYFKSEIEANRKVTLSLGVTYLGISLGVALNPAKLMGKDVDFELNLNCYGRRFGFDVIYQNARNFTGWHDEEGMERIELPDEILKVQTLNLNGYYVFNHRRFSYPAAFSQSYIQRRSAGSFLLAASGMAQNATLDWEQGMKLRMTNVSLGGGYGYNFVIKRDWLLHVSALPTFIVYSRARLWTSDDRETMPYHFPEFIATGRLALVHNWGRYFAGGTMVYNYTLIGDRDHLQVGNSKWRARAFIGFRF